MTETIPVNITIDDLTTIQLDGTGIFDKLMQAVTLHIDSQYKAGRIKGPEYAQVYLGSIQSVISQSMQFLLQKELVERQTEKAQWEVETAKQTALAQEEQKKLLAVQVVNTKAQIPLELFKTQLNSWTTLYNTHKVTDRPTLTSAETIQTNYTQLQTFYNTLNQGRN